MNQLQKLSMTIIMSVGIYFLLTLPNFIAFFTMDIDTGHYYGYVYPFWVTILIALISGPLGVLIVNKLEKNK